MSWKTLSHHTSKKLICGRCDAASSGYLKDPSPTRPERCVKTQCLRAQTYGLPRLVRWRTAFRSYYISFALCIWPNNSYVLQFLLYCRRFLDFRMVWFRQVAYFLSFNFALREKTRFVTHLRRKGFLLDLSIKF